MGECNFHLWILRLQIGKCGLLEIGFGGINAFQLIQAGECRQYFRAGLGRQFDCDHLAGGVEHDFSATVIECGDRFRDLCSRLAGGGINCFRRTAGSCDQETEQARGLNSRGSVGDVHGNSGP